jgi:hypothetical protein
LKKEAKILFAKSLDAFLLSIDHFNRPWDRGREETVLILLDRAFELLLKAAIVHKGGKIREPRAAETIGFDKCVRKCLTEQDVRCLNDDEALTIQIINSLRDAAQHYILEVSEQQLYLYTQAGVTLYGTLVKSVFSQSLEDHFPQRVLPVSTDPPKNLAALISAEFSDVKELLQPASRKQLQAKARLRSLAVVEASLQGKRSQPSEGELGRIVHRVRDGVRWQDIFPGIATLRLDMEGTGLSVTVRLTKKEGEPVQLVPEGTPGATVVAVRKVNELSFYSLSLSDLARKISVGRSRTLALVRYLKLQESDEYFKEFIIGRVHHKRYSAKAIGACQEALSRVDMAAIWKEYGSTRARVPQTAG